MKFLRFLFLIAIIPSVTLAQLEFDPNTPSPNILPSASDFATEVLGNPWDMNSIEDIGNYVVESDTAFVTTPTFSNGIMSTTVIDPGAYVNLLSTAYCSANPSGVTGATFPIDTTKYRYLNIRMYSAQPAYLRIGVTTSCNWFENFWTTTAISTFAGWHTYQIDLQTIAREPILSAGSNPAWNAVPATGLRIHPSTLANNQIKLDWVSLATAPTTDQVDVEYSFTSVDNKFYSMFVQDYNDSSVGFLKPIAIASNSSSPRTVNSVGLFPGEYQVVGFESNEWSSLVNAPWDMNSSADVPVAIGLNGSFSAGKYSGVTTSGSNYLFLNSQEQEIDVDEFKYLRVRMGLTGSSSGARLFVSPLSASNSLLHPTLNILVSNGTNNYDIDLSSWSGNVDKLQITLVNQSGVNFELDYVSLRNDGFGGISSDTPIVSPWTFKVNEPPAFKILQPDNLGGADYATEVLNNPWNFEDTADTFITYNTVDPQILPNNNVDGIQGNFYTGTSINGDFDPHQYSILTEDATKYIDTNRYKNVVFRLLTARDQDINDGSVVRIVWRNTDRAPTAFFNGDDIITFDGWYTYHQDMRNIQLEELNHAPGSYPNPIWYGLINAFRVDAHEWSLATSFFFDFIRITADDEANTKFAITYELSDTEQEDVDVNFYYNTTGLASGGTLIGTKNISDQSSVLIWNTAGVPNGTYYIYGVASDPHQSITAKATGKIVINHSRAQDTTAPVVTLDSPADGDTIYDDFVVRGYALDNLQTASVEVLVDGELLGRFNPLLFDSRAQDSYQQYTESGNAGFFETINAVSILPGTRTFELRVYDTGGNVTSRSFTVNKATGSDPNPDTMPPAYNAAPITVTNPIFAQPNLGMNGSLKARKRTLNLNVSDVSACGVVNLYWGSNKKMINNSPQFFASYAGGKANLGLIAKKLLPLLDQKKKKIFFKANCDGYRQSNIVGFRITNIKGTRFVKAHKGWIKQLRKKISVVQ